eukprot:gnl/TRDRNA2_/TRDRNA2_131510_c1_seq1.p2 gnl/TRDRNA2_/TRDRNA2_131510_c1~~gnl/TRDRNA2_/TRDRNA2_131510_c1_seq1.p2  ORF type:complete len:139 (+),score=25.57 gnl/TRDRNA2_/TRDRNA2_131510_c1_seq1:85-501(+)
MMRSITSIVLLLACMTAAASSNLRRGPLPSNDQMGLKVDANATNATETSAPKVSKVAPTPVVATVAVERAAAPAPAGAGSPGPAPHGLQYDEAGYSEEWHTEWRHGDYPDYKDTHTRADLVKKYEDYQSDQKASKARR